MKSWKNLEDRVRDIASLKWNAPCRPEHLDGVDFDSVCRINEGELIILEVTKEKNLDKVRRDINKIFPTKTRLMSRGVICRAFIVLEEEPTDSMVEAGVSTHITVCSIEAFEKLFFNFQGYTSLRKKSPFGSAVNSKTGSNDERVYIGVDYVNADTGQIYDIRAITKKLQKGESVVLLGDYGTGKSRCVRELFEILVRETNLSAAFPLAINLRDHWSSSSALEIIAGHLGNIGLGSSIDNVMRLLNSGHIILLLDGFDEIGTQVHDTRIEDRRALRTRAVSGVRDLIQKSRGSVLITGRSHFFDSEEEMLLGLGLAAKKNVALIKVPETFTKAQGESYLKSLGLDVPIPNWLPRKPLVFQTLIELEKEDAAQLLKKEHGEANFWGAFIYAICQRESKGVGGSISPQTIRYILQALAAKTRYSPTPLGRLTPTDIDSGYQDIVGSVPDQSGRQLLSRMFALGRIEPESPDRQFVDLNILDILRSESLLSHVIRMEAPADGGQWRQALGFTGLVHASNIIRTNDLDQLAFAYLKKFGTSVNSQRTAEIVSALILFGGEELDFQLLQVRGAKFCALNLSNRIIRNLEIIECVIEILLLERTPIKLDHNFRINESIATLVAGVSSEVGLPKWIVGLSAIEFEMIANATRIKESPLTPSQKLFLSIVHKIFFQPGSGREESALLKGGYGQRYSPKLVETLVKILQREGLVTKSKGDNGFVYSPVRRHAERMMRIRSEMSLSDDPIWLEITALKV